MLEEERSLYSSILLHLFRHDLRSLDCLLVVARSPLAEVDDNAEPKDQHPAFHSLTFFKLLKACLGRLFNHQYS